MPNPVASSQVAILSPAASQTVAGTIVVMGEVDLQLDAAGSHLMVDGATVPSTQVTTAPYNYALDTTTLADGTHSLQLWAHDSNNDTVLSGVVVITVANAAVASSGASGSGTAGAVADGSSAGAGSSMPSPAGPVTLTYPASGQGVTGTIAVMASITSGLDAGGSYLMLDGTEVGTSRVTSGPYLYTLDTTQLPKGTHTLQIWAHDTNNAVLLSNMAQITVN